MTRPLTLRSIDRLFMPRDDLSNFKGFKKNTVLRATGSINYSRDASVLAESASGAREYARNQGIRLSEEFSPLLRARVTSIEEYLCLYVLHKGEPMVTRAYGPVSSSMDDDVSYVCSRTITQRVELL